MATVVEAVAPTPIATAPAVIGPITGTISTMPRERSDQDPVGLADRPERERQDDRHDCDQDHLAAHECAELQVDQCPGIADQLALRSWHEGADEADRPVALEDPVGGAREHEEDPDHDFERLQAELDAWTHEARRRRKLLQPLLQRDEELVLYARRVVGRLVEIAGRRGKRRDAERLFDLPERAGNDEPDEQPDQADKDQVVNCDAHALRHAAASKRLDSRSHRRSDHEGEEEERDDEAEAPDGNGEDPDAEHDERPDGCSARRARELLERSPLLSGGHVCFYPAPRGSKRGGLQVLPVWAGSPTQAARCFSAVTAERLGRSRSGQVSRR